MERKVSDVVSERHVSQEIYYQKYLMWLTNIVLVKKFINKWYMCVDYIDLNKSGLKDCFPLPRINHSTDSTWGHVLLSFTDAFLGYN